jgi:hypothetical protein
MRCLLSAAALLFFSATTVLGNEPLPSRILAVPPTVITAEEPANFDLVDFRADQAAARIKPVREIQPHTIFGLKHHIGIGGGYDNGVIHGSIGFYVTVAEWGNWNFGVPSPALGFGRYRVYDEVRKQGVAKEESSIFVSLASVHYRAGRIDAWGVNWYVNLEQVFDIRRNMAGSQVGVSFSRK